MRSKYRHGHTVCGFSSFQPIGPSNTWSCIRSCLHCYIILFEMKVLGVKIFVLNIRLALLVICGNEGVGLEVCHQPGVQVVTVILTS